MKRAAIYTRVSRDEQATNYSLPTQERECRDYATRHSLTVVAVLRDDETGATLERAGLAELRDLVRRKQIDAVIAHSTDRLHRDMVNQLLIRRELQAAGVAIHYVRRGELHDTPEARFTDNIEASVAEYERERIRERTMRGTRGKAEAGRVIGGGLPKYGYRYEGERREKQLVIDEHQAAIVAELFRRYDGGESVAAICRDFSARGVPSWSDIHRVIRKQRQGWDESAMYGILRDEAYAGTAQQMRHVVRGGKLRGRDKQHWIAVPCPAIISRDLWQRVQGRLDSGIKLSPRKTRRHYLLRGLIRCGACGYALIGATTMRPARGTEDSYYKCSHNDRRAIDRCDAPFLPVALADDAAWALLERLLERDSLEAALKRRRDQPAQDAATQRRAALERDAAAVQAESDRWLQTFARGYLDERQLDEKMQPLLKRRDAIAAELATLDTPPPPETMRPYVEAVYAAIFDDTAAQRRMG